MEVTVRYGDASITVGFEESAAATPATLSLAVTTCGGLEHTTVLVTASAKVYYSTIESNQGIAALNYNDVGLDAATKGAEKALDQQIGVLVGQAYSSLVCPEGCGEFKIVVPEPIPPKVKQGPTFEAPWFGYNFYTCTVSQSVTIHYGCAATRDDWAAMLKRITAAPAIKSEDAIKHAKELRSADEHGFLIVPGPSSALVAYHFSPERISDDRVLAVRDLVVPEVMLDGNLTASGTTLGTLAELAGSGTGQAEGLRSVLRRFPHVAESVAAVLAPEHVNRLGFVTRPIVRCG